MALKDDMKAYQARWAEVEAVVKEEQRNASLDLRWRQLNAVVGMAKGLGILKPDKSEGAIYRRWAKLRKIMNRIST